MFPPVETGGIQMTCVIKPYPMKAGKLHHFIIWQNINLIFLKKIDLKHFINNDSTQKIISAFLIITKGKALIN
jgi:hypothetical protein